MGGLARIAPVASNPVLPGFHPDPSICRAGDDFYLVASSFEYFPGLPIFTSRDLASWRPIGYVLDRESQLPLRGVRASGGLYAPTIRHHDGLFWLVCTLMGGQTSGADGVITGNFVVTAEDPAGPWSEPTWLGNPESFDPSLLFDGDDVWFCATRQRPDAWVEGQTEVWVQRFDPSTRSLVGEQQIVWHGALVDARWAEAPHLYAVPDEVRGTSDPRILLLVAEGGTAEDHSATVARADSPLGPFRNFPRNPVLTHRHLGLANQVTAVGHADLVDAPDGSWWAVCLATRPLPHADGRSYVTLGRETFLSRVTWEEGWPVVNAGHGMLRPEQPTFAEAAPQPWFATSDPFHGPDLDAVWRTVREPLGGDVLRLGPDGLVLRLVAATLGDLATPAFLGRPQDSHRCSATVVVDVDPQAAGEVAGLALRQTDAFSLALVVARRDDGTRVARAVRCADGVDHVDGEVQVPDGSVELSVEVDGLDYRCRAGGSEVGVLDGRVLSTDVAGGFTGVMLGPYASGGGTDTDRWATFTDFSYRP